MQLKTREQTPDTIRGQQISLFDDQLEQVKADKNRRYSSWEQYTNDTENLENQDVALRLALVRDASMAADLFATLCPLLMRPGLRQTIVERLTDASNLPTIYGGGTILDMFFTQSTQKDEYSAEVLAAKARVAQQHTLLVVHFILNSREGGRIRTEYIYHLTTIVRSGHLTGPAIDRLNSAGITTCSSTATKMAPNANQQWYLNGQINFRLMACMVIDRNGVKTRKGVVYRQHDNYVVKRCTIQQKEGEAFFKTFNSCSTLVCWKPKREDFDCRRDRKRACTLMDTAALMKVNDVIFTNGGLLDLSGVLKENGDWIRQRKGHQHLPDWTVIANSDDKSSRHAHSVTEQAMARSYCGCEPDPLDSADNQVQPNELIQCCDTEFLEIDALIARVYPHLMEWTVDLISPMHMGKHGHEICMRSLVFQLMIFQPFAESILFKLGTFGRDGLLLPMIHDLATDAERVDIGGFQPSITWSTRVEYHKALDGTTSNTQASVVLEEQDEEEEEEEEVAGEMDGVRCHAPASGDADDIGDDLLGGADECSDDEYENDNSPASPHNIPFDMKRALTSAVLIKKEAKLLDEHRQFVINREAASRSNIKGWKKIYKTFHSSESSAKHEKAIKGKGLVRDTATNINFGRVWSTNLLLAAIYEASKAELSSEDVFEANALTRMVHSYMEDIVWQLCVEPMQALKCFGDIHCLYQRIPMYVKLLVGGDKPKVAQAATYLTAETVHLKDERPDILRQAAQDATLGDELFVEHHHSPLSKACERMQVKDTQGIRNASVIIAKERNDNKATARLYEKAASDGDQEAMALSRKRKTVGGDADEEGAEKPRERDSEVAKYYRQWMHGGKKYEYVLRKADWFKGYMRGMARADVPVGVAVMADFYRPLRMYDVMIDESIRHQEKYLVGQVKFEIKATAKLKQMKKDEAEKMVADADASDDEEAKPKNIPEFYFYLEHSTKALLYEVIQRLAIKRSDPDNPWALYPWKASIKSVPKPKYIENILLGFGAIPNDAASQRRALKDCLAMCAEDDGEDDPVIKLIKPSIEWSPTTTTKKKESSVKDSLSAGIARIPDLRTTIAYHQNVILDADNSPFRK